MKRRRSFLLAGVVLLVIIGAPGWLMYRGVQQERLNRTLIEAIKREDTRMALSALEQGADANAQDTPPDKRSSWERLLERLRSGFRPSSRQTREAATPALFLACGFEPPDSDVGRSPMQPEVIKALVQHGADVNAQATEKYSPLMVAVLSADCDVIEFLLDHGANVNASNYEGLTALMWTLEAEDSVRKAALLLDHGADIRAQDNVGDTILIHAALYWNADLVKLLLEHGARVNARNHKGETALLWAAYAKPRTPQEQADIRKIVKVLLACHADVNLKSKLGDTPLKAARSKGYPAMVKLLQQAGAKE